ncbi:hypothetical protein [Sediminibacillus albus]|uniref:Flagellar FliJ protein n=1 Tax=Sediminibacillus albus TaxID=407036 RepID=A0A1G8VPP4_9BACI|nr:hypothetical protein [Sediminibacillus albus]SDJ68068.1 hypothetical protein SAMN05216243_0268 [Sediminibacillus albus]
MGYALKETNTAKNGVSKQAFEKAYIDLTDRMRLIDQKLATKADEVVLTLTLSHRQEIEELQTEVLKLHEELKKLKSKKEVHKAETYYAVKTSLFRGLFKRMQLSRK